MSQLAFSYVYLAIVFISGLLVLRLSYFSDVYTAPGHISVYPMPILHY